MSGFGTSAFGVSGFAAASGRVPTSEVIELIEAGVLAASAQVRLYVSSQEAVAHEASATLRHIANLEEGAVLVAAATSRGQFHLSLQEAVTFSTQAAVVFRIIAIESFDLATIGSMQRRQVIAAIEYLEATALATSRLAATQAVIDAIVVHELAQRGWRMEHAESVAFAEALQQTRRRVEDLVAEFATEALLAQSMRITLHLADGVVLADEALHHGRFLEQLSAAVDATAAFKLGNQEYVAWVLNTESEAVSRYTNFGFNSFADYAGRQYALMDDGLYELTGENDDGAAINAVIRGGLGNFGSSLVKGMAMSYLCLTTDGELVLKFVIDQDGRRECHWYKLEGRTSGQDRVKPDGGLSSVNWSWELINLDGAAFTINEMSFVPMLTSRRV